MGGPEIRSSVCDKLIAENWRGGTAFKAKILSDQSFVDCIGSEVPVFHGAVLNQGTKSAVPGWNHHVPDVSRAQREAVEAVELCPSCRDMDARRSIAMYAGESIQRLHLDSKVVIEFHGERVVQGRAPLVAETLWLPSGLWLVLKLRFSQNHGPKRAQTSRLMPAHH